MILTVESPRLFSFPVVARAITKDVLPRVFIQELTTGSGGFLCLWTTKIS